MISGRGQIDVTGAREKLQEQSPWNQEGDRIYIKNGKVGQGEQSIGYRCRKVNWAVERWSFCLILFFSKHEVGSSIGRWSGVGINLREQGLLNENGSLHSLILSCELVFFRFIPVFWGVRGEERMPQAIYLKLLSPSVSCWVSCLVLGSSECPAAITSNLPLALEAGPLSLPSPQPRIQSVDHIYLAQYL